MPLSEKEKVTRYLRQVIVMRKDLSMPSGKLAAMAAHAGMSFITSRLREEYANQERKVSKFSGLFTEDQKTWLTELDPGLEDIGQLSFAKIVVAVNSLEELLQVENSAYNHGLECHRVTDSGYSHNPAGAITCIAVGPAWPEQLFPVTGKLPLYR